MTRPGLMVVGLVLLFGCGSEASPSNMEPDGNQPTSGTSTVTLEPAGASPISGSATATVVGDSTTVTVSLTGGTSGTNYPVHIHDGTCAVSGGIVVSLMDVVAGENGSGMSTTMVETKTLNDARQSAGALLVMAHFPDGTPCACGALPWPP